MKLKFVWVGKTRSGPFNQLLDDYLRRISRYSRVEISEVKDRSDGNPAAIVEREGEDLLARLETSEFVIALDESGRQMTSVDLADLIASRAVDGTKEMTFVIGGPFGLSAPVTRRADLVLSLSRMTLPHEMARLFLAEQVYRAFTITKGLPYHK